MLFINETYQSCFFLFCLTMKKIKIFSKQSKINLLEKSRGIKKTLTSSASDRITTHFTFEAMRKPSRFFSRSQTRKLVLDQSGMRPDKPLYNLDLTNTDREPKQTKNSARNMTKYNLSDGNYRYVWKLSIHELFLASNLEQFGKLQITLLWLQVYFCTRCP